MPDSDQIRTGACRLDGLRVVVTRAAHQAEELAGPLRALGAEALLVPVIGIAAPSNPAPLREAAAHCGDYEWIIFTSANAVAAFAAELRLQDVACSARVATVGDATREAAEQSGFRVSLTPDRYVAESLVEAFETESLPGTRILIPSAAVTRDVVAPALRNSGAEVNVVEAYRNVTPLESPAKAAAIFREPYPDWVTFASSSAVDNLVKLVGAEALRRVKIASIGPITSQAATRHGLAVAAEASVQTIEGIIGAISFQNRAGQ